jgi:hypothetical protein
MALSFPILENRLLKWTAQDQAYFHLWNEAFFYSFSNIFEKEYLAYVEWICFFKYI